MKRIVTVALMCIIVVFLLTACQCQHAWTPASCTAAKTCSRCGETEGQPLGHTWTPANCTAAKTCSKCGETEGQPLSHSWAPATCTTPATCTLCNARNGQAMGHAWSTATCETPARCSFCGKVDGQAPGHSWIPAVNLSGIEGIICTVCQEYYMPTDTWTPLTECQKYSSTNETAHFNDILVGDWQTRAGKLPDAIRFCVSGKKNYKNTHYIIYNLDQHYQYLSGLISFSNESEKYAEAKILIYLDNELAYESDTISELSHDASFTVDAKGVSSVRVVCSTTKEPSAYCVLSASVY